MDKFVQVAEYLDSIEPEIWELSAKIFSNPELGFQEHFAVETLTRFLQEKGFEVEREVAGLKTAFIAKYGSGEMLAFIAEYDAVSEALGHACGHNFIAAASAAAAAALKAANLPIAVIGTPAEESGGGKVIMARAGIFRRFLGCMYLHPSNKTRVGGRTLAAQRLVLSFQGREAHATRDPRSGIDALQSLLMVLWQYNAVRRTLPNTFLDNWIITHGGETTTAIPGYAVAEAHFFAEEPGDVEKAAALLERVAKAVETVTGATGQLEKAELYPPRITDPRLRQAMEKAFERVGIEYAPMPEKEAGFTDVGAVSEQVPVAEGYIRVCDASNHTHVFREAMFAPTAREKILQAAKVLAFAVLELLSQPCSKDA